MRYIIAMALVIASLTAAEPSSPRFLAQQAQEDAPYPPSGYRPQGPAFSLPQRIKSYENEPQNNYAAPVPSYGPPPEEDPNVTESSEETTEEVPDVEPLAENLENKLKQPEKPAKLEETREKPSSNPGVYFVELPKTQNYIVLEKSLPLLARAQLTAINPGPAPAFKEVTNKIITSPVMESFYVPRLQAIPVTSYSSQYSNVITPFIPFYN